MHDNLLYTLEFYLFHEKQIKLEVFTATTIKHKLIIFQTQPISFTANTRITF